jgi:hypothetical protein
MAATKIRIIIHLRRNFIVNNSSRAVVLVLVLIIVFVFGQPGNYNFFLILMMRMRMRMMLLTVERELFSAWSEGGKRGNERERRFLAVCRVMS